MHRLTTYSEAIEVLAHDKCIAIGKSYHRPLGEAYSVDKSTVGATGITQQHFRSGALVAHGNHRLTAAHIILRIVKQNLGTWRSSATPHDIIARQEVVALARIDIFERDHCHGLLVQAHSGLNRRLLWRQRWRLQRRLHRLSCRVGKHARAQFNEVAHYASRMAVRTLYGRILIIRKSLKGQHLGTILIGTAHIYFCRIGRHCLDSCMMLLYKVGDIGVVIKIGHIHVVVGEVLIVAG